MDGRKNIVLFKVIRAQKDEYFKAFSYVDPYF